MKHDPEALTYFDPLGVERWSETNKAVNQNSPFRKSPSGFSLQIAEMAQRARQSVGVSRAVARERARGIDRAGIKDMGNVGQLRAIDEQQTNAYGRAKLPNSMKAKP